MKKFKGSDPQLTAGPLDLPGLADYQEGAIVSRTIIDKDAGTVTLFAFDKGQKLSPHSAPFDAFVQIIEGRALVIIDKEEYPLSAPAAILMPADIPHAVQALERFKMLLTMVKS
ncbi:MAG TPA: cupin domain-containing protein [Candidatus Aminicenantes bacterium]|nr:cupin domain-containing protein [Candidatus Aminicenantes bacterium]HOU47790.1 cupin domain-containing protein [Candidatus Aminicenantes bacterium]HQF97229.1 cupin domain-containing protein [Candidatus Aminicenantes bacterium]HQH44343.1 cupin domain-containing protein [Candidatus Aminicenantes bacterium]HQJ42178.1 cupin domain-containing protein [Candidatus Aminicenantes bacterium]